MTSDRFTVAGTTLHQRTAAAVADEHLCENVGRAVDRFASHRAEALAELAAPDDLRRAARGVRNDILADLPGLLERFADQALARGAHVCWASTAAEARDYMARLASRRGVGKVVKSKSMATEEIDLNAALTASGADVVETDLGEWIVQLADEVPSHIIAPALPKDRHQIHDLFVERAAAAQTLGTQPDELVRFARERLREQFLGADMGITGANLAVAETGSIVLVTNEGNGRLVTSLPPIHVVVLGMERLTATWDQADLMLALLARSATGQRLSSYTTVVTGPRAPHELDGPEELHIVVLDNGRSRLLAGEQHEMLGHAYGWAYPGPMGSVLTPLLAADLHPEAAELSDASTLCGACMDASPVEIPLQDMLLSLRREKAQRAGRGERTAWRLWATAWSDSRRYSATTRAATWGRWVTRLAGRLPVASSWTAGRELPPVAAERFRDRWWKGQV